MSDVTINSNKLLAMITCAVFAAGAAGAGLGAAVGIRAATPTAVATADTGAADRQALQQDRDAFQKQVRETLATMKGATGPGLTVADLRLAILQAEVAKNAFTAEERIQAVPASHMAAGRKWRLELYNTMK